MGPFGERRVGGDEQSGLGGHGTGFGEWNTSEVLQDPVLGLWNLGSPGWEGTSQGWQGGNWPPF